MRPLAGVEVTVEAAGAPARVARWLLRSLGARVEGGASGRAGPIEAREEGLPPGTTGYTMGVHLATAAIAGAPPDCEAVVRDLWLPEVVGAGPVPPRPPARAPGGGWLQVDLGRPGDEEDFERLLGVLGPGADALTVATAAQEWRLPVCDYRRRPDAAPPAVPLAFETASAPLPAPPNGPPEEPLRGVRVCELTYMWAGPLSTSILRRLGAEVWRVEPQARPDGFRASPAMWEALNGGKHLVDLDLRHPEERADLVALAGSCDLVIDSFSPRVMPNFGLEDRILTGPRRPVRLSMPAFGPGPERDWIAFGAGVHAVLGLGDMGAAGFAAPAVSYPDPVGGYVAAFGAMVALTARRQGVPISRIRTSLAGASAPLLSFQNLF